MPREGTRVALKTRMTGDVSSISLRNQDIFPQVFSAAERGYHPMVFSSVRRSLVIGNAYSNGYVGDG